MMPASTPIEIDIAIIGAGAAGLWLANRLQNEGYQVVVLDSTAIGGKQTLASQGMIHGGMKYTLAGTFTRASETISDMPRYWRACLCGEGEINLRHTRILSDHFFLWSSGSTSSKLTTFLASKLTRGRVTPLRDEQRPPLMRHQDFTGSIYKLDDLVIDTPSLIRNLSLNLKIPVYLLPDNAQWQTAEGQVSLQLNESKTLRAKQFILTAGEGNQDLLNNLGLTSPAMQRRPLQQVLVKNNFPFEFFGHCLGAEKTPRLTISSHRLPHGESVWYLGGSLAEKGANLPPDELIELAKNELNALIPWLSLEGTEWATLPINRAEPLQPGHTRPDNAFIATTSYSNLLVGWPTKLTLAPNLANQALDLLHAKKLIPHSTSAAVQLAATLTPAPMAKTPWELAFPPSETEEARLERLLLSLNEEEDN